MMDTKDKKKMKNIACDARARSVEEADICHHRQTCECVCVHVGGGSGGRGQRLLQGRY